jgi:hypothetical protein
MLLWASYSPNFILSKVILLLEEDQPKSKMILVMSTLVQVVAKLMQTFILLSSFRNPKARLKRKRSGTVIIRRAP